MRGVGFVGGGLLPDAARGTVRSGLVHSTDVFATLLRLATSGAAAATTEAKRTAEKKYIDGEEEDEDEEIDGVDQWEMIAFGGAPPRSTALLQVFSRDAGTMGAVVSGDLKLVSGLPNAVRARALAGGRVLDLRRPGQGPCAAQRPRRVRRRVPAPFQPDGGSVRGGEPCQEPPGGAGDPKALLDDASATAVALVNSTADPLADAACLAANMTFVPWLDDDGDGE